MPARPTRWIDTLITRDVPNNSRQLQELMGDLSDSEQRTATVIRIIIDFGLWSTTLGGAYGVQRVILGMGVTTPQAVLAGGSALPDPAAPAEKPVLG